MPSFSFRGYYLLCHLHNLPLVGLQLYSASWINELLGTGVADRVCLGLIPTSEGSWVTVVRALSLKHLKCPGNVSNSEQPQC
ncbi:tRNA wybutosine-synthesizing protein 2/3/4-like isoform X2 [Quercus suber]|uniref:tRNA wybutosine-synthesizing protein 2/3/4-like isoform X2 n=1 Tax=Quercus suber TaxID=58331 RepID=UPI0032DECFBF